MLNQDLYEAMSAAAERRGWLPNAKIRRIPRIEGYLNLMAVRYQEEYEEDAALGDGLLIAILQSAFRRGVEAAIACAVSSTGMPRSLPFIYRISYSIAPDNMQDAVRSSLEDGSVLVKDYLAWMKRGAFREADHKKQLREAFHVFALLGVSYALVKGLGERARRANPSAGESTNNGFPRSLDEAIERLMKELPLESKRELAGTEKKDLINYHFELGASIRNVYGLWQNNDELLLSCGKDHPDDASSVIVRKFWEKLREKRGTKQ